MLVTSWTLVHHINDASPLKDLTMDFLKERNAELVIQVDGYDETYNQQVTSRASYLFTEDVIHGAKFDRAFVHAESGTPEMDFSKLSSYTKVELDQIKSNILSIVGVIKIDFFNSLVGFL